MENLGNDHDIQVGVRVLPGVAFKEFPLLEEPGGGDLTVVERQIGRPPRGRIFIACRCKHKRPSVILTVPFEDPGRAVPPLLWLSCPRASALVGTLEGEGLLGEFARRLESDAGAMARFRAQDDGFAGVLSEIARAAGGDALARRLSFRGVAGGRRYSVKCLHSHLAYRLASGRGEVGRWCLEELERRAGSSCEATEKACFD